MPFKPGKKTVGATVTDEMALRIKQVAVAKHWSVSQTLSLFIDAHWDEWESEMLKPLTPQTKPSKSKT